MKSVSLDKKADVAMETKLLGPIHMHDIHCLATFCLIKHNCWPKGDHYNQVPSYNFPSQDISLPPHGKVFSSTPN